jgi:mRNA interferase RelE/StbE
VPWRLEISPRAEKDLRDLPATDREAVSRALDKLVDNPSSQDLKKLGGRSHEWRMRVGRWRVRLEFDASNGVMSVTRVLPRDRAYRD